MKPWTRQSVDRTNNGHKKPWTRQSVDRTNNGHKNPWTRQIVDRTKSGYKKRGHGHDNKQTDLTMDIGNEG